MSMLSSCRRLIVSVIEVAAHPPPRLRTRVLAKKNQACAPLPERERSIATGHADRLAGLGEREHVFFPRVFVEVDCEKPTGLVFEERVDVPMPRAGPAGGR
jgi:hypothetical protein